MQREEREGEIRTNTQNKSEMSTSREEKRGKREERRDTGRAARVRETRGMSAHA